jgi:hypothetical protein
MHPQLVSILVTVALVMGAGSALPYGHSVSVAAPLLGGGVPDEPGTERPRVLGTVASKSSHGGSVVPLERSLLQGLSFPHLLALSPAALARLSGAGVHAAPVIPVPLRC